MLKTNVCIVGAGPGGCATALKLSYLDIPCILIDKAKFPRDKVCGDAINVKITTLLRRLDPEILKRFKDDRSLQSDVWGIRVVAPNTTELDIPFTTEYDKEKDEALVHVSKRFDFDNFLIEEVKHKKNIQLFEEIAIEKYEKTASGFFISDKSGQFKVDCRILIVANGAHSSFTRKYVGHGKDPAHHGGAVRAYYKNVSGIHEDNFVEVHFAKEIFTGYFWIFPLPNGYANVGMGMRSDYISKNKFNLKKGLEDLIAHHPTISKRFEKAERVGKIAGYSLPLGSKKRTLSGDHYMLVGDAGHLVNPLTGEGIGNAFHSGFIAAEQVANCLETNDFSAKFMYAYDVRIARLLRVELRLSYQLQRLLKYGWLLNFIANWGHKNQAFIDLISNMCRDFELRKQLVNPVFWLKFIFNRKSFEKYNSKKKP